VNWFTGREAGSVAYGAPEAAAPEDGEGDQPAVKA
jgi:hypothetical protein